YKRLADFFAAYLKDGGARSEQRVISYYTLGEQAWRQTAVWPPRGVQPQHLYFNSGFALTPAPDDGDDAADKYQVDFTADSGKRTRWHTNISAGDVDYGDRAAADAKLLSYTTTPLADD